jgi:hypothetical protein
MWPIFGWVEHSACRACDVLARGDGGRVQDALVPECCVVHIRVGQRGLHAGYITCSSSLVVSPAASCLLA